VSETNQGYFVEYKISRENLELYAPLTPGLTIGLDVWINDDDDGGARDAQLGWANVEGAWGDTSTFGDVELSSEEYDFTSADLNNDGEVNIFDLVIIAKVFGLKEGMNGYLPEADFNNNQEIDIADLVFLVNQFN
jgi:hypothetical protein